MGDDNKEKERVRRGKVRAAIKRTTAVDNIKAIHAVALRVSTEPKLVPELLSAVNDLDTFWSQFRAEDDAWLDALIWLDEEEDYVKGASAEIRGLVHEIKVIADNSIPKGGNAIDLSYLNLKSNSGGGNQLSEGITQGDIRPSSRLPDIPLPEFDGDFKYWPTFRDRFMALVDANTRLSSVDKMFYLIGCLRGTAADAVRGIPVSSESYDLAMSKLASRFNRPRMVATSLVDKLLHTTSFSHESLHELTDFVSTFSESVSLLHALRIPDLGSFILFSIAFRSLPVSTRTLFESNSTSDFPSLSDLLTFVQSRADVLALVGQPPRKIVNSHVSPKSFLPFGQTRKGGGDRSRKQESSHLSSLVATKPHKACPCCDGTHVIGTCTRLMSWSVDARIRWARENRLCFICLSADHWAPQCKSKIKCSECKRNHHSLLHTPSGETRSSEENQRPNASLCASSASSAPLQSSSVMLGTALVHAQDKSGSWHTMRALIDCASQISAVTVSCADRLGLRRVRWTTPVTGLGGVPIVNVQGRVDITVQPRFSVEPVLSVHAWVLPSITGDLPRNTLSPRLKDRYENLALADPTFNVTSPIDLLLGGDVYSSIMEGRKIVIDDNLPAAFNSIFGWVLIGPVSNSELGPYNSLPVSLTVSIEGLMENFWRVEEPEVVPDVFTDEGQCEQIYREQCIRLPSGRFSVPLPFRAPVSLDTFTGSREVAVKRFESLERKLAANPKLSALYVNFMSEYIALGHMSVATSPGQYFIPHHAVYRPEAGDGKIRVVFDASARSFRGPSLNSCLLPGPKLQQDIVDILTRFRVHRHAFTADICKMYRQIHVLPNYRTYQHILWRASPHDKLCEYELKTVTYGVNCAPYLALRVLRSIASEDCDRFDSVRQALESQTYVDDICVGADSEDEALKFQSDLITVLGKSGLELKKWATNTSSILNAVPADSRGGGPLPFDSIDGHGTKVLGIEWHPAQDYFCCALRIDPPPVFTKRGILSLVARIFDPLGFFAPAVFLAKSIMQRTWQCGLSWDARLPDDIHSEWAAFVSDLSSLLTIRVPRYLQSGRGAPCYLLGFCDASQRGYAAVIYLRVVDAPADNCIFLIGTKTKLAPMNAITIPRLELNAAVLLARWLGRIRSVLESQINVIGTHAWSDSTIVLSWLTVPHEAFKIYVSNRVHLVHTLLPNCQWHHIDSANNPADCASRGITPSELSRYSLYWHGPSLVHAAPDEWGQNWAPLAKHELPEVRPVVCTNRVDDVPVEWFNCFSSFDRMIRVVARVHRFVTCCRRGRPNQNYPVFIRKAELYDATRVIILASQMVHFTELRRELVRQHRISSKPLARLSPFIDSDGVIRVGGRLKHSSLHYDCKHPVLIAKRAHFARLLCERWHKYTCHSGPRVMSALISRQYWIVSLRSVLHEILSRCTVCVRLSAKAIQPLMADLPAARVQQSRPFTRVGVDYAGPLQLRELRLRKSRVVKIYIAVFVCFAIKAVHLEVVSDLSTEAFLAAFDRFVARRGLPTDIYSDCGTNFVGADKQLHALINGPVGQEAIANSRATCEWHFNPPSAPHFGGLWEAAVQSTKRLLVRVIGTHIFTYEEFATILARVEAVLNSRPLTPATNDPHDLECLTPGHFLIGQPLLAVPPRSLPEDTRNLVNRWKLLDQCHQAFWKRWSREYLTTLQERSKWTRSVPNLNVNELVVVVDNQSPPLVWRLGRITEVLPGADGTVRVAKVLTSTGHITRPVVKLVPLPVM